MKVTKRQNNKVIGLVSAVVTAVLIVCVGIAASDTTGAAQSPVAASAQVRARGEALPTSSHYGFALGQATPAAPAPAAPAPAGAPLANGAQMSDQLFKNIQVLKGIPVDDFMATMGIMSASLSMCCDGCHTGAGTDQVVWEADTPRKVVARRMVTMVQTINRTNFQGRQVVTCWTCHRGRDVPVVTPSIDKDVYGTPTLDADDIYRTAFAGEPTADVLIDKYLAAVGGVARLNTITSVVATGASVGFGGLGGGGTVQIYAKAPDQRTTIIKFPSDPSRADEIRVYNGTTGFITVPHAAVPEYQLGGIELDGARLDAELTFPGQLKRVMTNLRVGPPETINGKLVHVVQGTGPRGLVAKLYFDHESGLLVRVVRLAGSPIGRVPTQVDYSDYRDVNGIKIPYKWTFGWLDGRNTIELKQVQLNAPVNASVFERPPAPTRR